MVGLLAAAAASDGDCGEPFDGACERWYNPVADMGTLLGAGCFAPERAGPRMCEGKFRRRQGV
jgi:hypothetical protein